MAATVARALHLKQWVCHVEARSFWSASLERTMPYRAHLDDHLRFYNASLKRRAARSTIS